MGTNTRDVEHTDAGGDAQKLIDPRPNVALAAKTADILVTTDGLVYATDWNAGLNALQ